MCSSDLSNVRVREETFSHTQQPHSNFGCWARLSISKGGANLLILLLPQNHPTLETRVCKARNQNIPPGRSRWSSRGLKAIGVLVTETQNFSLAPQVAALLPFVFATDLQSVKVWALYAAGSGCCTCASWGEKPPLLRGSVIGGTSCEFASAGFNHKPQIGRASCRERV